MHASSLPNNGIINILPIQPTLSFISGLFILRFLNAASLWDCFVPMTEKTFSNFKFCQQILSVKFLFPIGRIGFLVDIVNKTHTRRSVTFSEIELHSNLCTSVMVDGWRLAFVRFLVEWWIYRFCCCWLFLCYLALSLTLKKVKRMNTACFDVILNPRW